MILAYIRPPHSQQSPAKNMRADSLLSISDMSAYSGSNSQGTYQIALVRRFDFTSKLQRMSVIVKNFLDQSFRAFVKGSPERLLELCHPSTIPYNYEEILGLYTQHGYRVLALATRTLDISFLKS